MKKWIASELHRLSVPILHAIEFKEMIRNLGQPDLQSDDEIRALTLFLHGIGSLLHFDDHRHNLDDLYFVKPQWLCKLMSTVVIVEDEYVKMEELLSLRLNSCLNKLVRIILKSFLSNICHHLIVLK